ncbi:MAG: citrate transporter [Treponema sp.]|jgi:Na+/H+ antiporter NhaD/arsenite permease-like protein|nr:citrate transporter [Treponema sp.]
MQIKWIVLGVVILMYTLIIIFPDKKAFCSLGTAMVMLFLGAVSPGEAAGLVHWNVLMIFTGSHIIAELFIYSGAPAAIADILVRNSPAMGKAMTAIIIITGLISAIVENVAAVLVMTPIVMTLCAKLKKNPSYFIAGLAVMANLQGTATLVGDPPSMIFAEYAYFGFNDFFVYQGKASIFFAVQIGMLVGVLFFYGFFAKRYREQVSIEQERILSPVPSILLLCMIAGLTAASFLYGGISPASGILVLSLGITGLIWFKWIRKEPGKKVRALIKDLDWDTVFFLAGVFIVVGVLSSVKLPEDFAELLSRIVGDHILLGFALITGFSILISGFIDNVPYITAVLPVASSLAKDLNIKPELYMFAVLIGSCMGGNLTPLGASANVVSMGILKKRGFAMNFTQWIKIGLPFTLFTTGASSVFIWLIWR